MITIIEGPAKSGKTTLANSLRNQVIGTGTEKDGKPRGCLLIDEQTEGEPRHLLEKIIHADALPADGSPVPADKVNWKHNASIVIVGKKQEKMLSTFEKLVPGITDKLGPVKRMNIG
jgi:hypothetical protein